MHILLTLSLIALIIMVTASVQCSSKITKQQASTVSLFDRKVYKACSNIPKGKVTTYKLIAQQIGSPKAFRAVGTSLRKNPFAPKVS